MMGLVFLFLGMTLLSCFIGFWLFTWLIAWVFFFFFFFFISFDYHYLNVSYMMGLDLLSYLMILLSLWIGMLMFISSMNINYDDRWSGIFRFFVIILIFSLFLAFSFMNLFMFYVFFEVSLIPTLFIILGWGYQPERLQAGMYLFYYTLFVSLPMMISMFMYYKFVGSLDFFFFSQFNSVFMYFFMIMGFLVKMPIYMAHLWLPKAHVEAPVSGSMILAGVMLKLGGYGLMRVMKIFISVGLKFNTLFISVSMVGMLIISFVCLRQSDMKSLIAYSSVCHMGLVLSGILTLNYLGMVGSLCLMLGHGLCSSGLFCLVNICYERVHSRSLYLNKGFINIFPSFSLWWFLLVVCNMAAPPSINLLGEIVLISSLISYNYFTSFFLIIASFMSAVYSLYLYSFSQHGSYYGGIFSLKIVTLREYFLLFMHWFPLNFVLLKSDMFLCWI